MSDTTRKKYISFRVNPDEHALIEAKRSLTGMNLREFLMTCVTEQLISVKPGAPLVAAQIARVGNNLNQLTRHVNSGYMPSSCLLILTDIRNEIREIRRTWQ